MGRDDVDRPTFTEVLVRALKRFDARPWTYCLMGDHYRLVLILAKPTSRLMRHINGVYTHNDDFHGLRRVVFYG